MYGANVVLLVGGGNNGGDALFAGARLARRGARVTALLVDPARAHAGGLAALRRAGGRAAAADPDLVAGADLVVDGVLGIGGRGGLRGPAAALAQAAMDRLTVAVDVPSGVDADSGVASGAAVRADVTVTFGCLKPGLVTGTGAALAGEVRLVDIGLGPHLPPARTEVLEAVDVLAALSTPARARRQVHARRGRGDRRIARVLRSRPARDRRRAARRCGHGALPRALAGADPLALPRGGRPRGVADRTRCASRPGWSGPGLGTDDAAMALLADVLRTDVPVIVDADAITLVARAPGMVHGRHAPTVLTPHDREFARLAGEPGPDRLAAARRAAADLGVTVLLKSMTTVVAAPDGAAFVNPTGTPWLATAGSGDVLSGLIGSLLATGLGAAHAAAVGAYVHGVAGQQAAAGGPPAAGDILAAVRGAILAIETR